MVDDCDTKPSRGLWCGPVGDWLSSLCLSASLQLPSVAAFSVFFYLISLQGPTLYKRLGRISRPIDRAVCWPSILQLCLSPLLLLRRVYNSLKYFPLKVLVTVCHENITETEESGDDAPERITIFDRGRFIMSTTSLTLEKHPIRASHPFGQTWLIHLR